MLLDFWRCETHIDLANFACSWHMQTKFEDISSKLKRFQRPNDFEPKMGRISKMLTEVEQGMRQLELNSESPDIIQDQLVQCMVRVFLELYNK